MDHTEGAPGEERVPVRPEETGKPLPAQDARLPWEMADAGEALPPPPTSPEPDPSATLPWEPIGPVGESSASRARHHDEELPDWLQTEEADTAPGGSMPLISMADLELLAAAELDPPSEGVPPGEAPTQRTVWGPTPPEPPTESFDPEATAIRLPTSTPPRPPLGNS
jgi:hypothetical protein